MLWIRGYCCVIWINPPNTCASWIMTAEGEEREVTYLEVKKNWTMCAKTFRRERTFLEVKQWLITHFKLQTVSNGYLDLYLRITAWVEVRQLWTSATVKHDCCSVTDRFPRWVKVSFRKQQNLRVAPPVAHLWNPCAWLWWLALTLSVSGDLVFRTQKQNSLDWQWTAFGGLNQTVDKDESYLYNTTY